METSVTRWQWSTFAQLSAAQLYALLRLRQQVFIIEQQCLFADMDDLDQEAHHLLGWRELDGQSVLAAGLRCIAPGVLYEEMSIGRVVSDPALRGLGIGRELMEQGIARATQLYPGHRIRIGAQQRLQRFYASLGFVTVSAPYDEDGIMHVEMLR